MRTFAALAASLVLAGFAGAGPAGAQNPRCSRETFSVGGGPLGITVCAGATTGRSLAVAESFTHGSQSFTRSTAIELLPQAPTSRTVDDVSLTPLGLPYTLHLTLAASGGEATIEHALLLPGAVPLK